MSTNFFLYINIIIVIIYYYCYYYNNYCYYYYNYYCYYLLCNVGLRHQNLSYLNRTHNEKNENKNIYIQQKININKTSMS